jgi:hypothetical protein
MRSGEVSLGDNPAGNEVDDKQRQPTDGMGPVPPGNDGEAGEGDAADQGPGRRDDADKPLDKYAERAASERRESSRDDGAADDETT